MGKKTQLIFIGAPGSGKGTQASKLVRDKSFKHVSTGELLRAEIKKESELGKKVEGILKSGQLVDNNTVLELLETNIDLSSGSYIFDGYPRNLDQANALDEKILKDAAKLAFYFEVDVEGLVERLTNRRICRECGAIYNLKTNPSKVEAVCDECSGNLYHRDDDKAEVIRDRMKVFASEIDPVLNHYAGQNVLVKLNASEGINALYDRIVAQL